MARVWTLNLPAAGWSPDFDEQLVSGDDPAYFTEWASSPVVLFDDVDPMAIQTQWFRWPAEYAGGTVKGVVQYGINSTSGNVKFELYVKAMTVGDTDDLNGHTGYDSANGSEDSVPGTALMYVEHEITISNKDNVAAGDIVRIGMRRDTDGETSSALSNAGFLNLELFEEE